MSWEELQVEDPDLSRDISTYVRSQFASTLAPVSSYPPHNYPHPHSLPPSVLPTSAVPPPVYPLPIVPHDNYQPIQPPTVAPIETPTVDLASIRDIMKRFQGSTGMGESKRSTTSYDFSPASLAAPATQHLPLLYSLTPKKVRFGII
jgi:hypothetical protein